MTADPHPEMTLQWLCEVEGNPPRKICHHCREPWPCTEGVRRHKQTDFHRWDCIPTGRCYYARSAA